MTTRARFDIHVNTRATGIVHAADCVVEEDAGSVRRVDFRYTPRYLESPGRFPLDPVRLPLSPGEVRFRCEGGVPGFIDDHLPDAWGRKVLTALAHYRDGRRLNLNSAIDQLALVKGSGRIGALAFVDVGGSPDYSDGAQLESLSQVEGTAGRIDASEWRSIGLDEFAIAHLAETGSGIGGARPKALVGGRTARYLAKFNRTRDDYNNARVELACLEMARAAGLKVAHGRVVEEVNARDVLLLARFDVELDGHRRHLASVNALLKEPDTQRDSGLRFRYDDIAELLTRHSGAVQADLEQLARLALFNRAINNTDDHARNFSLVHDGDCFRLSPAYDLVPSMAVGEYHAAAFGYETNPPRPSEVARAGRMFGLSKPWLRACADEVIAAVGRWGEFAQHAGVTDAEAEAIARRFNP
ncbi:MAG: type II toxin-antitoxin system HipA family toxin [Gammaproteobacteria bacterium]|nr:type II toxin-antitoxin system HipA family toxin [Gammaproteobacteria bacterium]MYE80307.1 type II toxin-antitoxin system HipA family toxin [Gammaproteobacteria bacterium]